MRIPLALIFTVSLLACSSPSTTLNPEPKPDPKPDPKPVALTGTVVFTLGNDVYRITANPGSSPENLSALVWGSTRKPDRRINISSDGAWLVWESQNADPKCDGLGCLVIAPSSDPKAASLVRISRIVRPNPPFDGITDLVGTPTVASGGGLIVYPVATATGSGLNVLQKTSTPPFWNGLGSITATLGTTYNEQPSLSSDGGKVIFDCGDVPYGNEGTDICQLNTDGTGFVRVFENDARSQDSVQAGALHHPAFNADGSVVFEASWNGEQLWRAKKGDVAATRISSVNNDNSPCVLPDGRVVSLWLDRPGNSSGAHELRVVNADGSNPLMLVTGQDISDIGIGCGK
jgi:hypothetical protein